MSDVNLRAQIEILSATVEELKTQGHEDRQAVRALMRDLSVLVRNMEQLPELVDRVERVIKNREAGQLKKGVDMAEEIGYHPQTLRAMAERGEIPGYQRTDNGHWLYDPVEVKQAIKELGRQRETAQAS